MKTQAKSWLLRAIFESARRCYSRWIYAVQGFRSSAHRLAHERLLGSQIEGHSYER
jgi:hypothetical protein